MRKIQFARNRGVAIKRIRIGVLPRIIALFALIILPIMIIGLTGLRAVNQRLEQEVLVSVSDNIRHFTDGLDDQLRQTHENAGTIMIHESTLKLANPYNLLSGYDRVVQVNIIRNLLTNIKRSNALIDNVKLYLGRQQMAYSSDNYTHGSQQTVSAESYDKLLRLQAMPGNLHRYEERLIMLRYSSLNNPIAVAEIEYNTGWLMKQISSSLLYENAACIFRLTGQDFTLSSTGEPRLLAAPDLDAATHSPYTKLSLEGVDYYVFYANLPYISGEYFQLIPAKELFVSTQSTSEYAFVFTVIVCVCMALFLLGAYRLIHRPLHELIKAFGRIKEKDFGTRVPVPQTADFAYLYDGFNDMAMHLEVLIQRDYRQKLLLQKAELKQLQAQINPHFLYNSFFMLNQMITRGMHEESKQVAKLLGGYFQFITRSYSDTVTLSDEYRHTSIYIDIQSRRFAGRVRVEAEDLPRDFEPVSVPRLILQPIVENAFNYGMEDKAEEGLVRLSIVVDGEALLIKIEDNGENFTDDKLDALRAKISEVAASPEIETTGILNIYKRLQIYYQQDNVLAASRSELGGLCVAIRLFKTPGGQ